MNPEFFRIAATKTTDSVALLMLAQLERAAQELAVTADDEARAYRRRQPLVRVHGE